MTVHATSSGGGGRIGAVAALIGVCVSGVGAGTYCVATALLPDPKPAIRAEAKPASKPKKAAKAKRDAQLSRLPSPASQAVAPTPTPARRSRPRTADGRNRSARATSKPRSHPPRRAPRTSRSSSSPPIPDRSRRRLHHRPEEGSSNHDPSPIPDRCAGDGRLRSRRERRRLQRAGVLGRRGRQPRLAPRASSTTVESFTQCPAGPQYGASNAGMTARNSLGPSLASRLRVRRDLLRRASRHADRAGLGRLQPDQPAGLGGGTRRCRDQRVETVRHHVLEHVRLAAVRCPVLDESRRRDGRSAAAARAVRATVRNGSVSLRNVQVVLQEDGAPSVSIAGGSLVSGAGVGACRTSAVNASDRRDRARSRVRSTEPRSPSGGRGCDFTFAIPCPLPHDSRSRSTLSLIATAATTLTVHATDSAGNPNQTGRTIYVDNHAAGATVRSRASTAALAGDRRISSASAGATRAERGADHLRERVELCRLPDLAGCVTIERSRRDLTSMAVRLPGAGQWRARSGCVDAAGNLESRTTTRRPCCDSMTTACTRAAWPRPSDRPRSCASGQATGRGSRAREILHPAPRHRHLDQPARQG